MDQKVDWVSQHVAFPDYFRKLFYGETGSLFPEFSMNLGAGQNFAQFTYYGVMRPDVLLLFFTKYFYGILYSLFFHNICALSVQLFYSWMKSKFHLRDIIVCLLFICVKQPHYIS